MKNISTKCQIEFQVKSIAEGGKDDLERRLVYRHSDGNPEAVLPELEEFMQWNDGRNNEVEYMTANFIYWGKRKREELLKFQNNEAWKNSEHYLLRTGYGVCENNEFHADINFFYEVIACEYNPDIAIKCYTVNDSEEHINRDNFQFVKEANYDGVQKVWV